jgi:Uma2 family endonuclease
LYRKIAILREYLLVSQDQASIERYVRQGDVWVLSEAVGLEASLALESIECVLSLGEVYDKVLDVAD